MYYGGLPRYMANKKKPIRDTSYFCVQAWMVTKLQLKGAERDMFAIVYGYCQDDTSDYHGSLQFASDLTGYSKNSLVKALQSLEDKNLIIKSVDLAAKRQVCHYIINYTMVDNMCNTIQPTCIDTKSTIQPTCIGTIQPTCIDTKSTIQPTCIENGVTIQPTCIYNNSNIEDKDNNENNINNNFNEPHTVDKPKKKNLYELCIDAINEYTDQDNIKELLVDYLDLRLQMKDKPLYGIKQWLGMLKKLTEASRTPHQDIVSIIKQSIEKGYKSFYPVNNNGFSNSSNSGRQNRQKFGEFGEVISQGYTEDEVQRNSDFIEQLKREGKQWKF